MLLDEDRGGDKIAEQIVKRFHLLDKESGRAIDFYYLGWGIDKRFLSETNSDTPNYNPDYLQFDLDGFVACRNVLMRAGIKRGLIGNANLILLDVLLDREDPELRFESAISIDLTAAVQEDDITSVGHFLDMVSEAAHQIQSGPQEMDRVVWHISKKLGLVYTSESILDSFLNRFGIFFGAKRLKRLVTKKIGSTLNASTLERFVKEEW